MNYLKYIKYQAIKDRNPEGIKINEADPTIAPTHHTLRATAQKTKSVYRGRPWEKETCTEKRSPEIFQRFLFEYAAKQGSVHVCEVTTKAGGKAIQKDWRAGSNIHTRLGTVPIPITRLEALIIRVAFGRRLRSLPH